MPHVIHKDQNNEETDEIEKGDVIDYGKGEQYDVTKVETLGMEDPADIEDGAEAVDDKDDK